MDENISKLDENISKLSENVLNLTGQQTIIIIEETKSMNNSLAIIVKHLLNTKS